MLALYPPDPKFGQPNGTMGTPYPSKKSPSRPLLFVNADADSLGSNDNKRRTRDVKSYLSGHYRRWKRQQTLTGITSNAGDEPRLETRALSRPNARHQRPTNTVSVVPKPKAIHRSPSQSSDDTKENVVQKTSATSSPSPSISISWHNSLTHGNSDPFSSLPIPVDARTNMHIQIFNRSTTVICWTTQIDQRLRDLLHNEALMHGVLAISKMYEAVYLPARRDALALVPESRQHYGELLRLMRTYFQSRNKLDMNLSIELIHSAMMFTFLARQYDEFELHMVSLRRVISDFGGLKSIGYDHTLRFLNAEQLRSLFLLKQPLLPVDEWAPKSAFEEEQFRPYNFMYQKMWARLSSSTVPVIPGGKFAPIILSLFADFRDMLALGGVGAMMYRTKQSNIDLFGDWMGLRSHALMIKTAEVIADITKAKQARPSLELSLHASACLAASFLPHLIRSSLNPTFGLSYIPFTSLSLHIREITSFVRSGKKLYYQELYLWILFVGACAELASRTWSCDPHFRGSSWCSTNLAYMIEELGIDSISELRSHLQQYLLPQMFESYMVVLFERRHELIKLCI